MPRRPIIHVLLSLVLLISQQMALAHVMSHWSAAREASASVQNDAAGKTLKSAVHDRGCAQCSVFAQVAFALDSACRTFLATEAACRHLAAPAGAAERKRTVCVFQSRAPPQA